MTDERCVIFDLDGVLVDSEPHWRAGFRETIDTLATGAGLEPPGIPDDELVAYEGGRVPDTLAALVRDYLPSLHPLSPALLQEATDTCVAASSARIAATPRTIEDSVRAARDLHDAGYTLAVASSSARPFIDAALSSVGLDDVFEVRESAFDVDHAKPHPEVYLKAMAGLRTDPTRCVAIEDSVTGVRASLAAGLSTIWRTDAPRTLDGIVPRPAHAPIPSAPRPWLISVTQVSSDTIVSAFP